MRVITDAGATIDLGIVETAPTIGIIDYSRRVTDDFGVTTVAERGFSRRMAVRLALPFMAVDWLQRQLTSLRATPAQWIADDRFAWLSARGFYKDFSIDLNVPPQSYCTLTIEGLAGSETFADPGGDPAPEGQRSTLQVLQPVAVTDGVLAVSNVPENDAPEWSAGTIYPSGAQVVKAATHRVYESLIAGNVGDDPADASGKWLDTGPTNRWAMFDQALGTTTDATGSIAVTINAGGVKGVALLDVTAATVRVQAAGYDRTVAVGAGTITFLDLPGTAGQITVTIAGSGQVSVGTLLVGSLAALGLTEASPTAAITDYSRKEVDDFGAVTVVQRAWAKKMTAAALIRTDAVDLVASRIAAVRARPSLWIGQQGLDSLTIYGFFKDFSITVGEAVSKLSLSIEGLSTAAKVQPLQSSAAWPDITDPLGTKPDNNATVGAPAGTPVAGVEAGGLVTSVTDARSAINFLNTVTIPAVNADVAAARSAAAADAAAAKTQADQARSAAAQVATDLASEVSRAKGAEGTINTTLVNLTTKSADNASAITSETTQRTTAVDALSYRVDQVTATSGANATSISTEVTARATADSALGGRIDGLTVTVGGNTTAITAETTARATADDALGYRVDTLATTVGANTASISDETLARTTADTALANRTSSIESRAGNTSAYTNANATFGAWPDGSAYPSQWSFWSDGTQPPPYVRVSSPEQKGGYAVRIAAYADRDAGLSQSFACSTGYWILEATVKIVSGDVSGAGAYIDNYNVMNFSTLRDQAGYLGPGGGATGLRRWSILFFVQDNAAGNGPLNIYAMSNWSGLGVSRSAKTLDWIKCGVRPATDAEVQAGKATGNIAAAVTRIATEETTRATGDSALATRANSLESQIAGSSGSGLQSRIETEEATRAANDSAIAGRTSTLESQLTGATGSNLQSRIGTEETTRANGDSALASRTSSLETRAGNVEASVSTQAGAISTLAGKAAAYVQTTAVAGNNRAQVTIHADANGGAGVDIVGDVTFSGALAIGVNQSGERVVITNTGFQMYDANNVLVVEVGKLS